MEKYKTIQEDIENVSNKEVVKQIRISRIAVALIIVSILCAVGGKSFSDPNTSMPTFLFTVSVFLFLGGIIKLFVSRSCYIFRPTKSRMKSLTFYFDVHEGDSLRNCIEMNRFNELNRLKREKDSGVKLEVMMAGDGKFAAAQILEYIPYTYEAITPVKCYYGDEARTFTSCFKA